MEAVPEEGKKILNVGLDVALVEPRLDFLVELGNGEHHRVFRAEDGFV